MCFKIVKPTQSNLVYSLFVLLLLYVFTLSVCIYKGPLEERVSCF